MQIDLHGRTAVVTGAGRGLGQGVALGLAEAGADLVLVGLAGSQDGTRDQVAELGREVEVIDLDVSDHAAIERVCAQITATCSSIFSGENCGCFRSSVRRAPRFSSFCVAASRSEPNCAKAAISRYWASSPLILPATFFIAFV